MDTKNIKFIAFIAALLIIGVFFSKELGPVKDFFYNVTRPISRVLNNTSNNIGSFFSNISSISGLLKENNSLVKENKELTSKLAKLTEVDHENEILRNQLGFNEEKQDMKLIPARVIGYSPTSTYQSFTLDKGRNDGAEVGKAIISEGYLVGAISEISNSNSEAIMINNSRSLIPVVMQESRASGLLKGGLKGLIVEDLPLDAVINKDELVVTSGLGGGMPPGIIIGKVADIISAKSEIFQKVTVKSPVEFSKLEYLFIVK